MEKDQTILQKRKYVDIDRPPVEPVITIRGKKVLTLNNFALISGLPKARKTSFMNLFLASALTSKEVMNIKVNLQPADKILLIDTEQSVDDFYTQIKYLKAQLKTKKLPTRLSSYLFREDQPAEILKYIEELIIQDQPKLVFIDNLTELVINPNDIAECKPVVNLLKQLTAKYNIAMVCIIHTNKGNGFTAGNLGSLVDRASQSVLKVEKDSETDISTLSSSLMRSSNNFEPVSIVFNNNTNSYEETDTPTDEEKTAKKVKFSMDLYTKQELNSMIEIIFEHQKEYTYAPLVSALKGIFGRGDTIIKQIVIPYLVYSKHLHTNNGVYTN